MNIPSLSLVFFPWENWGRINGMRTFCAVCLRVIYGKSSLLIFLCGSTSKIRARRSSYPCGQRRYNANLDMCCGGKIVPRLGSRPACCGTQGHDANFNMCCGGKIVSRLGLRPACCGTQRYDANFDMCCGGNVVSRSGFRPACCGTRGYDASFNSCCSGQVCWQIFRRILDCLKMTVNYPVNKNKGILVCQRDGILFCLIFSLFNRYPQF